ncbi:probable permease protein of ABC transporter system [Staphylococcus sp. CAG:324]|mgnify:FL=1|nr:probable permease protein of ABC transporter system [Staphylococcus sp. CAG:324]
MINLFKYIKKKDWFFIIIAIGFIVVQVWLELKMPDYTKELTKIVQSGTNTMTEVWKNGGMMLLCAAGSMVSAIICSYFISQVASSFSMTLREELFKRITSFSNVEMNQFSTPSLITRTTNDVVQMQNFMAMGVQLLFKAPIMAIWAICKISATDVRWTLATIICVFIIVICVGILIALCLPRFKKIQRLTDELNDRTRENISGVRVVRAFNAEAYQTQKFENVNDTITKTNLFTSKAMGLLSPIMNVCMNGLMIAIYFIGAILINAITSNDFNNVVLERVNVIGNMTAFSQYAIQVVMAFMMLIMIFIILPRTIVSGNRIYEVLKTKPSITDGKQENSLEKEGGEVEFRNVSFSYNKDSLPTISNISFHVKKGETLAIIGATGSGKSTIIHLIPRFYDATSGEVLVNGINVLDYKVKDLRNLVAIASQKAALFKGTIKDNITYGSSTIDQERMDMALDIAKADFVKDLEQGVDSMVAQVGSNFSGGQKQRISIARAVYKNAPIIIFDDTFSALDYKTDMLVRKKIKENLKDTTVIIIAQRIGTIMNADKIVVLDEGKIVGMGTHEQLLQSCSIYQEIALSQLSKEEL